MENARKSFGTALRNLREETEKSMTALARTLGVSVTYISDVENGRRPPLSTARIMEAAQFLGGGYDELMQMAVAAKGWFELPANENKLHREVGVALTRTWADLTDEQLREINRVLAVKE